MFSKVSRFQADGLLLLCAAIWGLAFVAQKAGMAGLGPLGFIGVRFALSTAVVLPLAWREHRVKAQDPPLTPGDGALIGAIVAAFCAGVFLQQLGLLTARVTNAGFLTAVYVVFTPVIGWLAFRHPQPLIVWPACLLLLFGVFLLTGASVQGFVIGDGLILLCAVSFAVQINLMGVIMRRTGRPFLVCLLQNLASAGLGLGAGALIEGVDWRGIAANLTPLVYAGVISGGLGFALQAFAQQHTPSADAAIIMSAEALFAALSGAALLHERLSPVNWAGAGLIFLAILLVEAYPLLHSLRARSPQ